MFTLKSKNVGLQTTEKLNYRRNIHTMNTWQKILENFLKENIPEKSRRGTMNIVGRSIFQIRFVVARNKYFKVRRREEEEEEQSLGKKQSRVSALSVNVPRHNT